MPFSGIKDVCTEEDWTVIYETLLRPAAESAGYACRRSRPTTGNIIRDIVNYLADADAVIADLTGQNANVFYELGIRHATRSIRGRSILITQRKKDVPSDLRDYAYHVYDFRS